MCSPNVRVAGNLYYTYCRNTAEPKTCGVSANSLIPNGDTQTVTVDSFPYKVIVGN